MTINITEADILENVKDVDIIEAVLFMRDADMLEEKKTIYKVQVLKDKQILKAYSYDPVTWKYLLCFKKEVDDLV